MPRPKTLDQVSYYPISWPDEKKRTIASERLPSRWSYNDFGRNMDTLLGELERSGIADFRMSTMQTPHSRAEPADPSVALWFMQRVRETWALSVLACDRYQRIGQNVHAIELTLQRLRLIEDYGCYTAQEAMMGAAYMALPPPSDVKPKRPWFEVLGVTADCPKVVVEAVYKALAQEFHPDKGGSADQFMELQEAVMEARAR